MKHYAAKTRNGRDNIRNDFVDAFCRSSPMTQFIINQGTCRSGVLGLAAFSLQIHKKRNVPLRLSGVQRNSGASSSAILFGLSSYNRGYPASPIRKLGRASMQVAAFCGDGYGHCIIRRPQQVWGWTSLLFRRISILDWFCWLSLISGARQ